jgi:hypothetical protein
MAATKEARINREGYSFTLKDKNIRGVVAADLGEILSCFIFKGTTPSVYAGIKKIRRSELEEAEWSAERVKTTPIKEGDYNGIKYELGEDIVWPSSKNGREVQ